MWLVLERGIFPSESEIVVTEPVPYPTVIFFIIKDPCKGPPKVFQSCEKCQLDWISLRDGMFPKSFVLISYVHLEYSQYSVWKKLGR